MSKKAAHFIALDFLKSKVTATPDEINAYVGRGNYAAKYVCYLKLEGYEIEAIKSGREIAQYKYVSDGDSATRNYKWVAPAQRGKTKTKKKSVSKMAEAVVHATVKAKKIKAAKSATKSSSFADVQADALLHELGMKNAGEYAAGMYAVDPDWDSMDSIDVTDLLR